MSAGHPYSSPPQLGCATSEACADQSEECSGVRLRSSAVQMAVRHLSAAPDEALVLEEEPPHLHRSSTAPSQHTSPPTGVLFGAGTVVRRWCGEAQWRRRYECTIRQAVGELLGTLMLVLVGTGSVAVAVCVPGAVHGVWQVAACWGLAVTLAILCTAPYSGAHLNPAVSLAFCLFRPRVFALRQLPIYVSAQLIGALIGAALCYGCFHSLIHVFEVEQGIVRGQSGSELSAMVLTEYFPNPAMFSASSAQVRSEVISVFGALLIEGFGTALLCFVIFALTDREHQAATEAHRAWTPYLIGLTVTFLIFLFAPLTQAGFNPARDFCPRLLALMAGWGSVAIPGPRAGFWVYIVGPLIGGPLGALIYTLLRWLTLTDQRGKEAGVDTSDASTACRPVGRENALLERESDPDAETCLLLSEPGTY